MTDRKTWWDYHDEIEALKEERSALWRGLVPDDPHAVPISAAHQPMIHAAAARNAGEYPEEYDHETLMHLHYATFLAQQAEVYPDVLALDARIKMLRVEQRAFCAEPDYTVEPCRPGSRTGEGWE